MGAFVSNFSIGEVIRFGSIEAIVTDMWWEGFTLNPKVRVQWFADGEQKEMWMREDALALLIRMNSKGTGA